MKSSGYILGFLEPVPVAWIQSGLMEYLLRHLQAKSASVKENVSLPIYSFKMNVEPGRVVVRDHYYTSPEYFLGEFNLNVWKLFVTNSTAVWKSDTLRLMFLKGLAAYFNSSMSMSLYLSRAERYKAPELWYPGEFKLNSWEGIKKLTTSGLEVLQGKNWTSSV
ncbi:MAG: hypothetical protein AABX70_05385, partial [Nanoarchaeota archaeon]